VIKIALTDHTTPDPAYGPVVTPENLAQLGVALGTYAVLVADEHSLQACLRVAVDGVIADGEYELGIWDRSDQAGAGGYHDTDPRGMPYGKAFRDAAQDFGDTAWSLSVIVSHELAEMLRDPYAQWWVTRGEMGQGGYEEALELCDRVEGASFPIDGLAMADFLTAAALNPAALEGPWDYCKELPTKDYILPDGYSITRNVSWNNAQGAYLKSSARFGHNRLDPSTRGQWWARKMSKYGRGGKRMGIVQPFRCPVCHAPMASPVHQRNPCSVPRY
jgi:hypothetical protein